MKRATPPDLQRRKQQKIREVKKKVELQQKKPKAPGKYQHNISTLYHTFISQYQHFFSRAFYLRHEGQSFASTERSERSL